MYVYSLSNPGGKKYVPMENFYDTLGKLDKQFSTYAASTNYYLDFLIQRLDQELKVSCNLEIKVNMDHQSDAETNYLRRFYNSAVNVLKLDSSPIQKLLNRKNILLAYHDDCIGFYIRLPQNIQTINGIRLDWLGKFGQSKYSSGMSLKGMLVLKMASEMSSDTVMTCSTCNETTKFTAIQARCVFDQDSTIVPLIINRGQVANVLPSGNNSQGNIPLYVKNSILTKIPFYVKSGNSYFELVSVEILAGNSGQGGHLYSFVKNPKTDYWYKFNDARGGEKVNTEALKDPIEKTGYMYLYQKCSEKKYNDHKNTELCEDISEVSFDPDNLGITKSPLYANDTNGDLQKNDMNNIDLAINSLKKHWQNLVMGILDESGKLLLNEKNQLITKPILRPNPGSDFVMNSYGFRENINPQTKNFNIWFFLSSIILFLVAILVAILSAWVFNPLSIALFVVGLILLFPSFKYRCFNYYLNKCFACCLSIDNDSSECKYTQNQNRNNQYPNMSYFAENNIIK